MNRSFRICDICKLKEEDQDKFRDWNHVYLNHCCGCVSVTKIKNCIENIDICPDCLHKFLTLIGREIE